MYFILLYQSGLHHRSVMLVLVDFQLRNWPYFRINYVLYYQKNLENERKKGKATTKTNYISGIKNLKSKCQMRHVAAYIIISYIHIYLYHLHIILLLFQLLSFTSLATGKVLQFQTFDSIQLQPVFDHHYNISNRKLLFLSWKFPQLKCISF